MNAYKCSRCGSESSAKVKLITVGVYSKWYKENLLNSLDPHLLKTTYDSMRTWKIGLCKKCLIGGYQEYLSHRIQGAKLSFQLGVLMTPISIGFFWVTLKYSKGIWGFLLFLLSIGMFLWGFFSLINGIICYFSDSKKFRQINPGIDLPQEKEDQAFWGEAERTIESLRKDPDSPTHGEYELPESMSWDSLGEQEKKKIKYISPYFEVVCVANSVDELTKRIPDKWKATFEKGRTLSTVP